MRLCSIINFSFEAFDSQKIVFRGDPKCVYYKWDIHKCFCFWSRTSVFVVMQVVLPKKGQKFMRQFRPTMLSIRLNKLDMKVIKIYFKFNGVQFANFFFETMTSKVLSLLFVFHQFPLICANTISLYKYLVVVLKRYIIKAKHFVFHPKNNHCNCNCTCNKLHSVLIIPPG